MLVLAGCDDPLRSVPVDRVELFLPTSIAAVGAEVRIWSRLSDASNAPVKSRMRWSSSNPAVATVSDSGVVHALAPGFATFRVSAGGAAAEVTLEVVRPYTLTSVGIAGEAWSRANGLNDSGQVVGTSYAPTNEPSAFVWDSRSLTVLGDGGATDIGVDGTVVGYSGTAAVAWVNGVPRTLFEKRDGSAVATAINRHGVVAGYWRQESPACGAGGRCFQTAFTVRGDSVAEIDPEGATNLEVWDINDAGWMVGSMLVTPRIQSPVPVLIHDGNLTLLPSNRGEGAYAVGLNNLGQVVGYGYAKSNALLWFGPSITRLPGLRPGTCGVLAAAHGNNDRGDIVGEFGCSGAMWRDGKLVILDYLHPDSGWEVQSVQRINERGQIVGYGRSRAEGGRTRAILLTPPQ